MVYILDELVTRSSLYEEVSRRKSYSVVLSQRGCVNRKSSGFAERSDRRVFDALSIEQTVLLKKILFTGKSVSKMYPLLSKE